MKKIYILMGIPGSGKSTYCKDLMQKEPGLFKKINNDSLRESFDFGVWSESNEKIIRSTRDYLIKEFIKNDFNILIDNVNSDNKYFNHICKIAEELNLDVEVKEIPLFVELSVAIERDSKRTGSAHVGEQVINKFWKKFGGASFKNYVGKSKQFYKKEIRAIIQDETKPKAAICDLDGTIAEISHRNPYDASKCLDDSPISHVVEMAQLLYKNGYKIIFCSGREDKYRDLTIQWLDKHIGIEYDLFMRPSGNFDKDSIIKENIYNEHIRDKYYIRAVIDDRLQVCQLWYKLNLPVFRVGNPDLIF